MKRNYKMDIMYILIAVFLIIMWFLGKNSEATKMNRNLILYIGGLLLVISILTIVLENFIKRKPIKRIGYVNKDDELNVSIRRRAGYASYEVVILIVWAIFGLSFSGILPISKLGDNWPLYAVIALPLINIIFTSYYSTKI